MPRRLVRHLIAAVAILLPLLLAASCDGRPLLPSAGTTRDLAEARAKWRAQRLSSYEYTLQRLCFCGETRPMRVTVANGRVQSVRPEGELLPITGPEAEWYPSVEGLFDVVARALAIPAHLVDVEFDRDRGFPHSIAIDYWVNVADDEISYLVRDIRSDSRVP